MFNYKLLLSPKENQRAISRALKRFDDYSVMVIILNSSAEVAYINQCGCEILETTIDKCIGSNWINSFVPQQQRVEIELGFKQLMLGRTTVYSEYSNDILTAEKNILPFYWRNVVMLDSNENVCGTLSLGADLRSLDDLSKLPMDISLLAK